MSRARPSAPPRCSRLGPAGCVFLFPRGPLCSAAGHMLDPGGPALPWGPGGSAFLFPLWESSSCKIGGSSITSIAVSTRLDAERARGTCLSVRRRPRRLRVWGWGQFLGVPDRWHLQPGLSPTNCDSGRWDLPHVAPPTLPAVPNGAHMLPAMLQFK